MNEIIIKKTVIFSIIFGAIIGLSSVIPFLTGILVLFVLPVLASPIVILYMKKNQQIGILDNQQGAILGSIIGFFSTVGFFATFAPMVFIISLIFKNYYPYGVVQALEFGLLFSIIIVLMVAIFLAMTNSATGMMTTFILGYFEKKPENSDSQLDIRIDN